MRAAALLAFAATLVASTSFAATPLDPPIEVSGAWKVHAGDDPAWAAPGFDDSAWETIELPAQRQRAPIDARGAGWLRKTIEVEPPRAGSELEIALPSPPGAVDLWVNGARIGSLGDVDRGRSAPRVGRAWRLDPRVVADGRVVVALRIWAQPDFSTTFRGAPRVPAPVRIGYSESIEALVAADQALDAESALTIALSMLFAVVGIYHIAAWFFRRELRGWLWYGILLLLNGAFAGLIAFTFMPLEPMERTTGILGVVSTAVRVEFVWQFLRRRAPSHPWRIVQAACIALAVTEMMPGWIAWPVIANIVTRCSTIGVATAVGVFVAFEALRGRAARPIVLGYALSFAGYSMKWFGGKSVLWAEAGNALFVACMGWALLREFVSTMDRIEATNLAIGRFVPDRFLSLLKKRDVTEIARGDYVREVVSVMFCDVRGFTTLAEALGPEASFKLVNEILSRTEPEVHRRDGFIAQYLGDGILAIFHGSADSAVSAAIAMASAVREFDAGPEIHLKVGIGINTGPLMLGMIGGGKQLDAGIVGDTVNLASRVEGTTKMYGAVAVISGGTHDRLARPGDFQIRELDRVIAKGKSEAVTLYEVLDAEEPVRRAAKIAAASRYAQALGHYRAGRFAEALAALEACDASVPGGDLAARTLANRVQEFLSSGAPEGWDGVLALQSK